MASVPLPVGASHSSQARPSTIRRQQQLASRERAASRARLRRLAGAGDGPGAAGTAGLGKESCWHHSQHVFARRTQGPPWSASAWPLLLQTLRDWPWFDTLRTLRLRFKRRPPGPDRRQPDLHHADRAGAAGDGDAGRVHGLPDVRHLPGALEKYFLQSLVPDSIARPVLRTLTQFASKASRVGSVGLLLLVATALAMVLTIDRTLNAHLACAAARPIAQRILVYWAGLTLGPLALGVSLSLTSYALSASRGLVGALPGGVNFICSTCCSSACLAVGHRGAVPLRAQHLRALAHAWAGGAVRRAGLRNGQGRPDSIRSQRHRERASPSVAASAACRSGRPVT
jgi:hypothetical protein